MSRKNKEVKILEASQHKVQVWGSFIETFRFCKEHLGLVAFTSILGFLISISLSLMQIFWKDYSKYSNLFIFPSIFFSIWVEIMIIKLVYKIYSNQAVSFRELFISPIGQFWRIFWVNIRYIMLAFVLPIFLAAIIIVFLNPGLFLSKFSISALFRNGLTNAITICLIWQITLISIIYLSVTYYFSTVSVVIEDKKFRVFFNSRKIVRGNFWGFFLGLLAVIGLIQLIPIGLGIIDKIYWKNIAADKKIFIPVFLSVYSLLSFPIQTIFMTILYIKNRVTPYEIEKSIKTTEINL